MVIGLMIARGVLGLVFASTALDKIHRPRQFQRALAGYRLLPPGQVKPAAIVVTACEGIVAVLLVIATAPRLAAWLGAALLLAFTCATAMAARRRSQLPCGCGGLLGERFITWRLVMRNLGLSGLAVALGCAATFGWYGPRTASSLTLSTDAVALMLLLIVAVVTDAARLHRVVVGNAGIYEQGVV